MAKVVVRNPTSGLVLDASNGLVTLEEFTGSAGQLFTLEQLENGRKLIRNVANGEVLDIEGGCSTGNIITYPEHGGDNQQWSINEDQTITSALDDLALDITESVTEPGTKVIAYERNGEENQKFVVENQ